MCRVKKRFSVLGGGREHYGLGLARAEPVTLAAFLSRAARVTTPIAPARRWADLSTARIAVTAEMLPLGCPEKRPGSATMRPGGFRIGSPNASY